MIIKINTKNLVDAEKVQAENYLSQKIEKMEKLLDDKSKDNSSLRVNLEKFNKNQAYKVKMVLGVGSKTLYSDEDSFSIGKAIDLAEEKLSTQIRKNFKGKRK